MKENTESINEIIFTHFPSRQIRSHNRGNQTSLFIYALKKKALSFKGQLQSGVATLGIGTVLLVTFYLFFAQLAEYGWK